MTGPAEDKNVVRIRFKNSRFAKRFQEWMLDGAKRDGIEVFFTSAGENEWDYAEDERALPGDCWVPGKND